MGALGVPGQSGRQMTKAYIYCRFSSAKQEKGDSLERQQRENLAYCEQHGWEVADEFADTGVSAWKGDNLTSGKLGEFANRVRAGEIESGSILCVEKLDRLSRQGVWEAVDWLREMTRHGLTIATSMDGGLYDEKALSSANPAQMQAIMNLFMQGIVANQLSETISRRVKSAWVGNRKKAAESNYLISAHAPGWLQVYEERGVRKFRPIPDRAAVVVQIYELAAAGAGARAIMKTLNDRNVQPWGRTFHHRKSTRVGWEHSYIGDILKSPAVEGDLEPGIGRRRNREKTGERIIGYFPRIVDADLVARARAAVAARKGTGGRKRDQFSNLFTGLVVCRECGGRMGLVGNAAKPGRYLQCLNAYGRRGCGQRKLFPYRPFETAALDAMLHLALDDRFFQQPDQTQALAIRLAETNRAIENQTVGAKRLMKALAAREESELLQEELAEMEAAIRALREQASKDAKALQEARGAVSPKEHANRVLEVRAALYADDYEMRVAARRKVADAVRSVVETVEFGFNGWGDMSAVMVLVGGVHRIAFDREGQTLWEVHPNTGATADEMLEAIDSPRSRSRMEAYFRRLRA
jgi:DNA invertase Pin-like site-specific DNA recombinase